MNKNLINKLIVKALSIKSKRIGAVHVSFILDRNRIVSIGTNNKKKTHPKSYSLHKTIHSELDAILNIEIQDECKKYHLQNVSQIVSNLIMFNVRFTRGGNIGNSKPCKYCQRMLSDLGFKEVWYTVEEGISKL